MGAPGPASRNVTRGRDLLQRALRFTENESEQAGSSCGSNRSACTQGAPFTVGRSLSGCFGFFDCPRRSALCGQSQKEVSTHRMQAMWFATNRLAHPSSHARHAVALPRNPIESCTGAAWALAHGNDTGDLHACQCKCAEGCCELARRPIVPKRSQVRWKWKYSAGKTSAASVN